MTVIIGVDPHPGTHTDAALDSNGSALAYLTVENTHAGGTAATEGLGRAVP